MASWQIIASFTYPHEAHMAQNLLDSEGIDNMLKDELTAQVHNFYSNAIGGVKIMVSEEDATRALEVLRKGELIEVPKEHIQVEEVKKTVQTDACPFCGSKDIATKNHSDPISWFVFLLLGLFLPVFRKSYKCFDCHKEWKYTQ